MLVLYYLCKSRPLFFDLIDLFLKVCARYRGCGRWQPGPEIIWLLLRHEASRGVVIIIGYAVTKQYLNIAGPPWLSTCPYSICYLSSLLLCTQGRISHAVSQSVDFICAVPSVASYLVNTVGQNKSKPELKFVSVWDGGRLFLAFCFNASCHTRAG